MNIVLDYCEQASCLAVLYTCRSYHSIAIPHVYREITVSTPRQLRAFIHTAEQAAYDGEVYDHSVYDYADIQLSLSQ